MPKMKTHRGTAKRFRVTGSGKIMRAKAYKSHILTKKSQKRKPWPVISAFASNQGVIKECLV